MQNRPALLIGVSEEANRFLKGTIKRVNPFLPVHAILTGEGEIGRAHV